MIIVEGPDGAGKTTLVTKIAADWELPIAPRAVSKETLAMVDLPTWVEDQLEAGWQRRVFDRFSLFSDPIYLNVPAKKLDMRMYNYGWQHMCFDRLIKDVRPIVIFCLPPWEVVQANLANDEDNTTVVDHMPRVYADYTVLAGMMQTMLGPDCYVYDYTAPNPGAIRDWLRKAIG